MRTIQFATLFIITILTAITCEAKTSIVDAVGCYERMLAEAKNGASLSSMVENYIAVESLASRAIFYQKKLLWKNLTSEEREPYINAILAYFATEADKVNRGVGQKDYVVLDTVKLDNNKHKQVGNGYQLAGTYNTQGGEHENFALYIVQVSGRCYIHDARWRDAWLSRFVNIP